jgi:protein ImuB
LALCGGLRLLRRDTAAERDCLEGLTARALAYTPWVSLDYPAALLLEIRGSLNLFGGVERLSERVRADFRDAGHRALLAAAPAPLPAWLLARSGREETVVDPTALRSRLGALPLGRLPLEPGTAERLGKAGLCTLRDLWRLPREGLARRYGPDLLRQLDRASGEAAESPRPYRAAPRFRAYRALAAETESLALLRAVLECLLKELADFLRERAAVTDRLELDILHFRRAPTRLVLQLRSGSRDPARFALLLAERLERTPLPQPATALCLRCEAVQAERPEAADLFTAPARPGGLDWDALLEQLQQRLGGQSLRFLHTAADHRPERAQRLAAAPAAVAAARAPPLRSPPLPTPARPGTHRGRLVGWGGRAAGLPGGGGRARRPHLDLPRPGRPGLVRAGGFRVNRHACPDGGRARRVRGSRGNKVG